MNWESRLTKRLWRGPAYALLAVLALLLISAQPVRADSNSWNSVIRNATACSYYMGSVRINEVRIGSSGNTSMSNQVELFNSGNVSQSVWKNWQLQVYYKSSSNVRLKGGYYLSSGFAANGPFIYNSGKALYLRNRNGKNVDIALLDQYGKLIDYVALEGKIQPPPSCFGTSPLVGVNASNDRSGDVPRLPDGGNWPASVSNTSGHTMGHSNICTSTGTDLVVNNDADNLNPIIGTTPVRFTVSVQNSSCSNTASNVIITDTSLSSSSLSGLAYTPSQGSVTRNSNSLTWSLGSLASGASATLTVTGTPTTVGPLVSTTTATSSSSLVNTGDDRDAVTLNVRDHNYVDFDTTTDAMTEGINPSYSANISSSVVPGSPITVYYTASGTGLAYTDLPAAGSVTIDPGSDTPNQTSIDFNVTDDDLPQSTRQIVLTLTGISTGDGAVRQGPNSTMTISLQDDDLVPILDYRMDEFNWNGTSGEVKDSSGYGFDATSANATTTSPGKLCRAGSFNGTTADLQLADSTDLNDAIAGSPGIAFSAWVYPTAYGTVKILQKGDSDGFGLGMDSSLGWQASFRINTAAAPTGASTTLSVGARPTLNQWYHLVGTYDQSTARLYVNGVLVRSAAVTGTLAANTRPLIVGSAGGQKFFSGLIDEAHIFPSALNATQVATLFTNESAGKNPDGTARNCASSPPQPGALNAVDVGANAYSGRIGTKVAGSPFNLDLFALIQGSSSVDTAYSGSVLVDLLANTSLVTNLDANRCPAAYTSLPVGTFNLASGSFRMTGINVADAWRDVRVRMRFPATGTPLITACSGDNFAVKPSVLGIQASDGDWGSAGTARVLNASGTGTPIHKAGQPFTLTATGYNASGSIAAGYAGSPSVGSVAALDAGASPGTLLPGSFSGSAGTVVSGNATYDEAGSISIQMQDRDFASVDSADTAADCSGYYVCSANVGIGRFVPDHLALAVIDALPACGSFTYYGQDLPVHFSLVAQTAGNTTTRNYRGSLARLDLSSFSALGFLPAAIGQGSAPPSGTWNSGVANPVTATLAYSRPASAIAPASVTIQAQPRDADGITTAAPASLATAAFRYGRVRLQNAYGNPGLDLALGMRSEYWLGSAWVSNGADTCTDAALSIAAAGAGDITSLTCVRDALGASGAACSGSAPASRQFKDRAVSGFAGDFNLWLKAPGAAGSVDVTALVPAWLQFNWDGSVANPTARASFGIFKSGPVIYRKENF